MTATVASCALSDIRLLDVWDRGRGQTPVQRAELLYRATDGDAPERGRAPAADELTLGVLDARLMDCRTATFGPIVDAIAVCSACAEELTFELDLRAVRGPVAPPFEPREPLTVTATGGRHRVTIRLLTLADLRAAALAKTVNEGRATLTQRCVLEAWDGGTRIDGDALPADVLSQISRTLAEHDPQADIRLAMNCPACGHDWESWFDIGAFLWQEIERRARGLLAEVHTLAASYGWTEQEILSMRPGRRQAYLELALG